MHTKFKTELTKYLHFLLRFANMVEAVRKSPIYRNKELENISIDVSKVPLLRIDVSVFKTKNKNADYVVTGLNMGF